MVSLPLQLKRFNSKGSQSKSFYHLAPTLWNDLPLAVREAECRNTFKKRLDKHWRGYPMRLDYKTRKKLFTKTKSKYKVLYDLCSLSTLFICLCETFFTEDISDSEIQIPEFSIV